MLNSWLLWFFLVFHQVVLFLVDLIIVGSRQILQDNPHVGTPSDLMIGPKQNIGCRLSLYAEQYENKLLFC